MKKQEGIRKALDQIKDDERNVNNAIQLLDLIPDLEFIIEFRPNNYGDLWVTMPYSLENLRMVRRCLPKGWKFSYAVEHSNSKSFTYERTSELMRELGDIVIDMIYGIEGATCHRVQTGTKEVPVYEVVCD